jgi:TRAP transporter 4TM/12TM fusion protein
MVDLEARKSNILPLTKEEIPSFREFGKKNVHLIVPIFILIYFLAIERSSPIIACFWSIVSTVLISALRKHTRMNINKILKGLEDGGIGALAVIAACAGGGIIIGNISLTGLALSLSMMLVDLAHGSLILLLILTMISSLILGMGLTTTSCYIILAVIVAPALIKLNVLPIGAHLFIFYFGIISAITPPVALAAYTGAGLAGSDPLKTGFSAFKIGLAAFILPFMFVYGPALLIEGSILKIALSILTASIGIFFLAVSIQGWMLTSLSYFERILSFICALSLIFPGWRTDLTGLTLALIILLAQFAKLRKKKITK